MRQRYTDFFDVDGTFKEVVEFAEGVIGPLSQERETLAVAGVVGVGYFVRQDGFVRNGVEVHRIYIASP